MPRSARVLTLCLTLSVALVAPRAARADTIGGRVLDPAGRPVAGATVIVLRGATVAATSRTRADGAYGPLTLAPGDYQVVAGAPGFTAPAAPVRVTAGGAATVTITLTVAAVGESVVVSAAQVELPLSRVTDAVTVIDRASLDALQIGSATDAVRLVPGLHVAQSGGPGGLASMFPRGGESNYTLVLVDGVPQNTFGGGFDAAHLAAADLDRLEIVRGPQSALVGGGAIGGIVHAVTRHGGPARAEVSIEGGSYGSVALDAGATGSTGAWSWGGRVDRLATDGDTRDMPSIGGPVQNADYERTTVSGSLAWSDRPSRRVRVDVRAGRNERGTPGPYGSDPLDLFGGLDLVSRGRNRFVSIGATGHFRQTPAIAHRVHLARAAYRGHFVSPFGDSDDDTRRLLGRYQLDVETRLPISAGVEVQFERADNTFVTDTAFELVPIDRTVSGWFVEARPVFAGRVFVNAGARLERIARAPLAADPFGSRPAFEEAGVIWSMNPKVSAAWLARSGQPGSGVGWTRIRGGAGTGIKPPDTFDIAFTDNPGLKPERSRSVDLGVEQALAGGTAVVDVTWFANQYDDLIVSVPGPLRDRGISRHRTDNISNARARGVELSVTWRPSGAVALRGAWTWLDTEILSLDQAPGEAPLPYTAGSALVRRPSQQGSLALTWTGGRARAFLTLAGRGTMLDLEPNLGAGACFGLESSCRPLFDSAGYAVAGAGAAYRVHPSVELVGRVSNLFDRAYEEVLGFPALGRSATVGIRVTATGR
jgi:outer membrane cobalamin receptor